MWPRGEGAGDLSRRSKASGLNGFVSFKRRREAEAALRQFDGASWSGSTLRVGWSKAVPTSGKGEETLDHDHRPLVHRLGHGTIAHGPAHALVHDLGLLRRIIELGKDPGKGEIVNITLTAKFIPAHVRGARDEEEFIKLVAGMTRAHGQAFEENLKVRERHNPNYQFLLSLHSTGGRLYEDLLRPERDAPYEFDDEGNDDAYSTDNEEIKESERISRNRLGYLARRRFEVMLRAMSGKRGEVARCMAFCLEHAEAASEIANIVIGSLLVNETPVPRKIARLHLISDIIHNSAVSLPSAWKYRQEFQNRLGLVFDHLSTIYHAFGGRMTAEVFKRQVVAVIAVWDDRI
ncbi:hypothetical protein FRC17_001377, partial [Serendipita sp. 399]